jgi:hypothetical protein
MQKMYIINLSGKIKSITVTFRQKSHFDTSYNCCIFKFFRHILPRKTLSLAKHSHKNENKYSRQHLDLFIIFNLYYATVGKQQ